jgi:hypothetical protein
MPPPQRPRVSPRDQNHLDALAIVYYLAGAFLFCVSALPIAGLVSMLKAHARASLPPVITNSGFTLSVPSSPDPTAGVALVAMSLVTLFALMAPVALLLSARFLQQRRRYLFSFVVAVLLCLAFPLGTVLGVFTIIVLSRESTKELYLRVEWGTRPAPLHPRQTTT